MTSEGVFKTDPVRLIRAYRLAAVLRFDVDPLTQKTIQNNSHIIGSSAGERIREELYQLLRVENALPYLKKMAESNLLFDIFPELSALKGCAQNRFHTEDVWNHTLSTIAVVEYIFANLKDLFPNLFNQLGDCWGSRPKVLLKLSALMHDIGKPASKSTDDEGNIHFYRHERIGVEIVRPVFERLKLSNADKRFIEHMISCHLLPLYLFQAEKKGRLTPKVITRFFMKNGEMTPFVLFHALVDQMAKEKKANQGLLRFIHKLTEDFFFNFKKVLQGPRLLTGHDLIREFGLSPSPLYKIILNKVEEKRLSGEISTKVEAITAVRQFIQAKDILPGS
jgi:putative nucleotidyltransferase with HDIG domain